MKLLWSDNAWEEYLFWQSSDRDVVERIDAILHDIVRGPLAGIGKPEPLRGDLAGWWSRRITADHRLVYRVRGGGDDQRVEIIARRYHYASRR